MKRYYVPRELRGRLFGELEPRLKRSLKLCGAFGVVVMLVLLLVPARRPQLRPRRLLPRERVARVLAPEKPEPARRVQAPAPKRAPRPAASVKKAAAKPQPVRKAAKPRRKPPRPAVPGSGTRRAGAGKRGREAGRKVAKELQETTASIDDLLSSISGTVAVQSSAGGGGGKPAPQKYAITGGREGRQLASIDGALEGTGAGKGGSSRGVRKSGVDIVDHGVQSSGDAASVWGRDSRSLMAVVERYKAGVKFCYDNTLKKVPHLAGKITLQMDIAPSGEVQNLQAISDSIGNAVLQRCIRAQVRKWRFQAIDEGTVRFTLPLVFSPPNS